MVDVSFGAAPTQDAVSQNEFDAFSFTIDAPVERIQSLEDFHGRSSGPFTLCPRVTQELPARQGRASSLVFIEVYQARIACRIRFIPGLVNKNFLGRIVPSGFEPHGSFLGWLGRTTENRALHPKNESFMALISGRCFPGLAIR